MSKTSNVSEKKTQGELLFELYQWSDLNQKDFAAKIGDKGRSRDWLNDMSKLEIIPMKEKYAICRAYPVITLDYFEGKQELPINKHETTVTGENASTISLIEKIHEKLKNEYIELLKENKMLHEKLLKLYEKNNGE